jgi:hypothetical protein
MRAQPGQKPICASMAPSPAADIASVTTPGPARRRRTRPVRPVTHGWCSVSASTSTRRSARAGARLAARHDVRATFSLKDVAAFKHVAPGRACWVTEGESRTACAAICFTLRRCSRPAAHSPSVRLAVCSMLG